MKKLLSKIQTILYILLVVIAAAIIIWLIGLSKNIVFNNGGIAGTLVFGISSALVIGLLTYFLIKRSKNSFSDRENIEKELQKEEIQNQAKNRR